MNADKEQIINWIRLIRSENVGPILFRQLINRFGSAKKAILAIPEIAQKGGLKGNIQLCSQENAEKELENAHKAGLSCISMKDPTYPKLLRMIEDAPPILYVKGNTDSLKKQSISVVGARNASAAGRRFTQNITQELAQYGYVITSGMARGIDTVAHQTALQNGTIAILAGGADQIYPQQNEQLYHQILENGLIISEQPPNTIPQGRHFPRRNRLIAGISHATAIIEAAQRSGSLITAKAALEQNREIFAAPGSPLDPRSQGTNQLLRDGAQILTNAHDIINVLEQKKEYNPQPPTQLLFQNEFYIENNDEEENALLNPQTQEDMQKIIIELLSPSPIDIDTLIRESKLKTAHVNAIIMELKLAGRIEMHPGGMISMS